MTARGPGRVAGAFAILFAQACAAGGAGTSATPGAASSADLEELYRARTDSARARFTPADADFMRGMIAHHAQAIEMASLTPANGASMEIRTLAARITAAQESEIALMRQWLGDRALPAPEPHVHGPERGTGQDPPAPGMLTPEQMSVLAAARGTDFDRPFLTCMIQHHEGAVTMVERLFATPGAALDASVFRIASAIQVDQRAEIRRMESMLRELTPRDGDVRAAPPRLTPTCP